MSDFFIAECMFWTAEYLLHTTRLMIERAENKEYGEMDANFEELKHEIERDIGGVYSTRLAYSKTISENPDGGNEKVDPEIPEESLVLDFSTASDGPDSDLGAKRRAGIVWDDLFPEFVEGEQDKLEMRLREEDVDNSEKAPEDEVFYVQLLDKKVRLGVGFDGFHADAEKRMNDYNCDFLALKKGRVSKTPSSLASTFEEAREIFKQANLHLTKASEYFKLDGWVTDHIKILQDISGSYSALAYFETDRSRLEKMLLRRAKMLGPIVDILNMNIFLNVWRQLSFEVGEITKVCFMVDQDRTKTTTQN